MNFKIILDNQWELSYDNDTQLALVFQLSDIREYEKRASSFSYPFELPGDHNNNKAFGFIYNIQNETDFDVNKKTPVYLTVDDDILFNGFLQLNQINVENERVSYSVTIYSSISVLFEDIADKDLCQFNMSQWNHQWSVDAIVKSWDTSVLGNNIK